MVSAQAIATLIVRLAQLWPTAVPISISLEIAPQHKTLLASHATKHAPHVLGRFQLIARHAHPRWSSKLDREVRAPA